ncbi:ABC transporter substrate-binding protein [Vallitalea okinawensis]|uniref:ABC transporter substrate-binding protein n=1 Tax=Vallitalea okinawensis TaxID=2078660 RepID=UPI0013005151|nr:ABC transporter substrate-binding protein [Vallitalea okinawensis]
MRKLWTLLVIVMALSFVGCSQNTETKESSNGNNQTIDNSKTKDDVEDEMEAVELDIFQFKVEIVEQLDSLIADFESEYPYISVNLDTTGGGEDYGAALKARMNSGNMPAIFNVPGPTERQLWFDYLEDLSNEPWVEVTSAGLLDNITQEGKVLGQPMNIEGYGVMYNRTILHEAGITDEEIKGVNSLSALRELFAKVDTKKSELGLEATMGWSVGGTAWWVAAYHTFNVPFAMQEDPLAYVDELNNGTAIIAENERFDEFQNLIDTFIEYSYPDVGSIDYEKQYSDFAAGKTAFMQQGNWTINQLLEIDPELDIAFLPIPLGDGGKNDSIPVGVPNYWVVNSKLDDSVKDAAILFLNYIAMSERGHQFLIDDAKFIPAFTNVDATEADPLAQSILEYSSTGKTIPWVWHAFPAGMNETDAKQAFQDYVSGNKTWIEVLEFLDTKWAEKAQ